MMPVKVKVRFKTLWDAVPYGMKGKFARAMNMEHGTYTVVVRDVATGITAKHSWTID